MTFRRSRILGGFIFAAGLTLGAMCAWVVFHYREFGVVKSLFAGLLLLTFCPGFLIAGASVWKFQITLGEEELVLASLASQRIPYRKIKHVEKRSRSGLSGGYSLIIEVEDRDPLEIELPVIGDGNLEEEIKSRVMQARRTPPRETTDA